MSRVPDFRALLIDTEGACNHAQVESAAQNELFALTQGLAAIGHLLWVAHVAELGPLDPVVERPHVAALGILVERLAFQTEMLIDLEREAAHHKHKAQRGNDTLGAAPARGAA